jgi:hypothetical protein
VASSVALQTQRPQQEQQQRRYHRALPSCPGTTSFGGYTYSSSISYVSGLLANSSVGVNHADTVGVNGANPVDGLVAVVEVKITGRPAGESANSAS